MHGLHLIADLHDCTCPAAHLLDRAMLAHFCADACRRHGLTVVGELFHAFTSPDGEPAGVTGTVVLAESHLAVHTWPELRAVTVDLYVCNYSGDNSTAARRLFDTVLAHFAPGSVDKKEVARGHLRI
ncbi:adenosylmethionine decarboxylase [Dechloromonas sp. ZS-1]|uniref:adenosylmethionine decarboxylase n=1 Tax=Dechloromonas sp. ZS-1 TaxID=3138067 RepID=UPI0031FC59DB